MEGLERLRKVAEDPLAYGRTLKERQKTLLGYLCSYVPGELIAAAGLHPFRLYGTRRNIRLADAHLQGYCCSLARGVLEEALAGDFSFLSGVVFAHTCDTMQRLSDIWRIGGLSAFHTDLMVPVRLDGASSRKYLIEVLSRFKGELEKWQGRSIGDGELRAAIGLENDIRRRLGEIYDLKSRFPGIISGGDLFSLSKAAQLLARNELSSLLARLAAELKEKTKGALPDGKSKRLVLAGGFCDQPEIWDAIAEAGGEVVGDDLCTGCRGVSTLVDEQGDPLEALADRYLGRPICPAKHRGLTGRGEDLLTLVREKEASGVIFLQLKFCDPHGFDYPCLLDCLKKAGIPSLLLELDCQSQAEGQIKTRIEAFLEMI